MDENTSELKGTQDSSSEITEDDSEKVTIKICFHVLGSRSDHKQVTSQVNHADYATIKII